MKKVSLFVISFITFISACSSTGDLGSSTASNSASAVPEYATQAEPATISTQKIAAGSGSGGGGGGRGTEDSQAVTQNISLAQASASAVDTASSDRKIIRNAELDLEADDPEDAQRRITALAELKGGFVVESQQSSSDIKANSRDIVSMTVRVPAARFGDALTEIRQTATRVVLETVKGEDVTEQFIDIEAQLKAKKALEQQFMEIMKRANTVGDALTVQSQLADVRGDIERIEGRKRFLANQSNLSTIKIRLKTQKLFAANSAGFGGRLSDSFTAGADVALNFVFGFLTFIVAALPFALFIGLPVFIVFRYVLRRQARPRSVVELAQDELKST